MTEANKIVEINGVKFEIDARTATLRQIQSVKVGDRVKVLEPATDYNAAKVHHGVVVGFEPFRSVPTVIIAYMQESYSDTEIKFLYYNSKSKEDIIVSDENDKDALQASNIVAKIESKVAKLEREIQDLNDRKEYFLKNFKSYWETLLVSEVA